MTENISILVVEDSREIATQVINYLTDKGLIMDYAANGNDALTLITQRHYDLVILDLMLPDADGFQLCGTLKQEAKNHLPVLMLTARDSLNDKLFGFEVGADDYLTKPFALEEVYARCMALSRRAMLHQDKSINLGELAVDMGQHKVTRCGKAISLTQTDFAILKALVLAHPNAVSKRQLVQKIWGEDAPETDAIRSHIYTLRNAIDKPFDNPMIQTVHGIGFKLNV